MLPDLPNQHHQRWVHLFGQSIIEKSTEYERVSGFYKLFALNLRIGDAIDYFSDDVRFLSL